MYAARLRAIGEMRLETVHRPVPGPGEVLVRVEAAGICGSDRHMFRGEYPTALPVTLGHEFCGIVEAQGEGATRIRPGTRVTCDPNIACGHCPACRAGRPNLCHNLVAIGVFRDGGFAEHVAIPEMQAFELPDNLDPVHGAFSEPLACCLHGLDVARIQPGGSVAILGGGVIGLLMVQLARLAGATTIVLATRQAPRRALALETGASHAIDPEAGDPVAAIAGPGGIVPGGVDVVLECAGVPDTFRQSIAMVGRGGTVVVFGVMPKGEVVGVEPFDLLFREVRLEGAYLNPMTHARAARMVAEGTLKLDSLVSRRIPLAEVPGVLAAPVPFGEVKTIVLPGR
ncbi:MAG TPA: zinc-dependent alcohol dehydrogenase family protein [Devosiaceae bacterium]|nr:zinc-dependent alcohol dehydrogenase family protein [Devosiaceae bacterium]